MGFGRSPGQWLHANRWRLLIAAVIGGVALFVATPALADYVEDQQFTQQVDQFGEPCPKDPEGFYDCDALHPAATIDWGDGSSDTVKPVKQEVNGKLCSNFCTFIVFGTHTYAAYGTYSVSGSWSDTGGVSGQNHGSFGPLSDVVDDQKISLSDVSVSRTGNTATVTATLIDDNPNASACGYSVEVNWEDANNPSSAAVAGSVEQCHLQARDVERTSRIHRARRRSRSHRRRRLHAAFDQAPSTSTFTVTDTYTYSSTSQPAQEASLTVIDEDGSPSSAGSSFVAPLIVPTPAQTTTNGASSVEQTTATLNGQVNAEGGTVTSCVFDWGTSTSFGKTAPCVPADPSGNTPVDVTAALSGLSPETTYYDEVVLTTSVGTSYGTPAQHFTTEAPPPPGAPSVVTGTASQLTATTAVISGQVNPHGPTVSSCEFEWGTTTSYGNFTSCIPASPSGSSPVTVTAELSGLTPDTTYHFRMTAANAGSAVSNAEDATFTTLPLCNVTEKFSFINAYGCLAKSGGTYVSTPGSVLQLNGLTLTPDNQFVSITLTPGTRQVKSSGPVTVTATAGATSEPIVLADSNFTWTEPNPGSSTSVKIASLTPPSGTKVAGIPLQGDLSLSFNKQDGTDMTGNASLPFGSLASDLGITGQIVLHTLPGQGLQTDALQITAKNFQLLGVGVKNLEVSYDPTFDSWSGGAEVDLPTPNKLDIAASLAFQHGNFQKFSGSLSGINFPIFGAVDLQKISVVFGVNPTTIGGGLGISFGPSVSGKDLVEVDGSFLYQEATETAAGFIDVNGTLTIASFKLASAYFDYLTTGMTKFGAQLSLGLPDASSSDPSGQPVYISADLNGALYQSHFDIDVNADVALNFIDLNIGANILVSDKALVACAELSAFGFTWNPGVAYTWSNGSLNLMADGCSVGPYETLNLGQASDASASRRIAIRSGASLLELKGTTGQPLVSLSGPHGQHVAVPTGSVKPYMVPGFMVLQDPANKITWIAIQHGGGHWRLTSEPGGSAIAAISDAPLLPRPSVSGGVSHKHGRWMLAWHLRPIEGQRVVFWEKGADVAKIIGSTSARQGVLYFTPAAGIRRQRTIEAQVISFGKPRADIVVTHYTAPPAPKPGRPRRVRVSGRAGGVLVKWKPAANAHEYRIEVDTNGVRLVELAPGSARSIVINDVVPITSATVKICGELLDGVHGPTVTRTFHART